MHETLCNAFAEYFANTEIGEDDHIFNIDGYTYNDTFFSRLFRKFKSEYNLTNCTLYQFKDSGCTMYYELTKDIKKLSKLCGHSSISVTARYIKTLSFDDIDSETDIMPNLL